MITHERPFTSFDCTPEWVRPPNKLTFLQLLVDWEDAYITMKKYPTPDNKKEFARIDVEMKNLEIVIEEVRSRIE